ncbi:DNA helicase II [Kiloniella litopenaei]|uniref:DNA 3'-5' helicase n=1 Tax=Kiloniella litopenaei TaxID=1549748 RepID=A0A0M2R8A7_9PROT|nr:UvrD-helicase domain-containing protein [Kiloniella litopenaei]KKJ76235.1 DNA helicase II [Kiloniella litopenaei]
MINESQMQNDGLPPYLTGLNESQMDAVQTTDGPVLVLAGAGTGKTRVLTTRLAHILATGKAFPGQVLAVTFTNKAAQEMKERVAGILNEPSVERWWLGTFHAIAVRMLRAHAEKVGLGTDFAIIDTDDQLRLVKQLLKENNLDDKKWPPKSVLGVIQRWKDRGQTPDHVSANEAKEFAGGRIHKIYQSYQQRMKELNACDFGDLLLHTLVIFQTYPDVLADYHRRFHYILVDEYQDTNVAQYLWLRLLAQGHQNVCCVGDDDQSIYGWRGAEVGNILRFEKDFPGAKVVRLERNYRSTGRILAAASSVISHNEGRLGKTLWTDDDDGEMIRVRGLWDGEAEARFVGEETESLQRKGQSLDQIAVLVRTGAMTREFEERFLTLGIPYRVIGGARFYERLEIRDALAYLRLVNSADDSLAFERVINTPKRGLGPAAVSVVHQLARQIETSLFKAAQEIVETDELRPAARKSMAGFVAQVERWQGLKNDIPHPELADLILEESGYLEFWQNDKSVEAKGRVENLRELVNALGEFESLPDFLEHVSLVMDTNSQQNQDMVSIMTLHGAKGLEFETVFLPGWEEGLFPNQRAMDEQGLKGLEEERRLAYVGLTRARERAIISFAANRRMHGSWASAIPSRFVDELPHEHIERESDRGIYSAPLEPSYGGFGSGRGWQDNDRVSPGMQRARSYSSGESQLVRQAAQKVSESKSGFGRGERVFHQKFGYGLITSVEGERLTISFDKAGSKKVLSNFVVPAEQAGM